MYCYMLNLFYKWCINIMFLVMVRKENKGYYLFFINDVRSVMLVVFLWLVGRLSFILFNLFCNDCLLFLDFVLKIKCFIKKV